MLGDREVNSEELVVGLIGVLVFALDDPDGSLPGVDNKSIGLTPFVSVRIPEVEPRGGQVAGVPDQELSMDTLFV